MEGLAADSASVSVTARDGALGTPSAERSGVARVDFELRRSDNTLVRSSLDPQPQTCASSCEKTRVWTLDLRDVADGDYKVVVKAMDLVGQDQSLTWDVTVDRAGDIYRASIYDDDDPSAAAAVEWARLGTHDARRIGDSFTRTRTRVQEGDRTFDEVRSVSTLAQEAEPGAGPAYPDAEETFTVEKGATVDDVNLDTVANLLDPAYHRSQYTPTAQGLSLVAVLRPWQHAPPAHASTATLYEQNVEVETDNGDIAAVARTWIDDATKLPLREELKTRSGDEFIAATYYDYDKRRLTSGEVPADFFRVARPPNTGTERTITYHDNRPMSSMQDAETGTAFTPYYLGVGVPLLEQSNMLFAGTVSTLQRFFGADATAPVGENASGLEGVAAQPGLTLPSTSVSASYGKVPSLISTFVPGLPIENCELVVTSRARASSEAAAWESEYRKRATAAGSFDTGDREGVLTLSVAGTPVTVYVLDLDETRLGLGFAIGSTFVTIEGELAPSLITTILERLEVLA